MDKNNLRQAILDKLQSDLDMLTRAAHMAREEATHDESKATTKYETHGQEAAYLAESQARLASEVQNSITLYKNLPLPDVAPGLPAGIGAVVTLENRGKPAHYLLAPRNGGLEVTLDGQTVMLITPQSPLGAQLVGAHIGDPVQLPGRPSKITAIG
jgi:transcription elongation GreA/GreB family factor